MQDDLSALSAAEIDSLPFGFIALAPDGTVRKYNRFEADLSRKDPQEVLGKNFFREVAPCTQVHEFEGRFRELVARGADEAPTLTFDFEFRFRHGAQKVRIAFLRSPLESEVIVTVNRLRDLELPLTSGLLFDPIRGRLESDTGHPVVLANEDFWHAFAALWRHLPAERRREVRERLGREWAQRHLPRVEQLAQRQYGRTLRETELHLALELLSGSLGVLGLGRFEVELAWRERGVILLLHHHSPFAEILGEGEEPCCEMLSGLYAGFLSHLSGRPLAASELSCSRASGTPCRFVLATESRLARLLDPQGPDDPELLDALFGYAAATTGAGR
jgi:photoactive yellow protein